MEHLSIKGNFSTIDPVEQYLHDCRTTLDEFDKNVGDRCPTVFKKGMDLVMRWGEYSTQEDIDYYEGLSDRSMILRTPAVSYESEKGERGVIWLEAGIMTSNDKPKLITHSAINLWTRSEAFPANERLIMALAEDNVICNGYEGRYAGGHGELNYFWTIIDRIWEKALPANQKEKAEREREMLAKRRALG